MNPAAAVRTSYRHLGAAAVGGDAPTGASARYQPEFLRLEAEVAKLDSVQGDAVSWTAVRDDAAAVLTTSKDLLAAAYLAVALHRSAGLDGLADGLALCADLIRTWWDGLHPVGRPRARRSALQWLAERVAQGVDADANGPAFERCREHADDLWELCLERFGGDDCGLGALKRAFSQAPPAGSSDPAVPGADIEESTAMIAADTDRTRAVAHLTAAADYFTRAEPHSPIGPLLQRALDWSGKSFEEVFGELLVRTPDAKALVWQSLGIKNDNG
jgi:type VI secretion system ImpA/VasJ family protein